MFYHIVHLARSMALAAAVLLGCHRSDTSRSARNIGVISNLSPSIGKARVTFILQTGGEHTVHVEVARTEQERQTGLMHRRYLSPDAGMLFIFEKEALHYFWMKNTLIPLDIVSIRSNLTVTGVIENTKPESLDIYRIEIPSRYVLEVNAGVSRKNGILPGIAVRFDGVF